MLRGLESERGATAIMVAMAMLLLLGIAAVAIDLGFGFNERRQDQTAADLAVMAGATEVVGGSSQQMIVSEILSYARANLDTVFTDEEWRLAWQNCTDPDRIGFDVGIGTPVDFQPMQEPSAWGSGDLECISQVSSYLRVRIPDQSVNTSFARILGTDELNTFAAAVARIEASGEAGAVLPFGIPGLTASGEICLKTSGSGTAIPPCQGPTAGGFGEIDSEFFGDFFGSPSCSNPGHTELAQNVARGLDHAVSEWSYSDAAAEHVDPGDPHPGDNTVRHYQNIGYDACSISGGSIEPQEAGHVTPPNTMRVATGFSPAPIEEGLISNQTFGGEASRLQQGSNDRREIIDDDESYHLDNKGLWDYLNDQNHIPGLPECDGDTYDSSLSIEEKVARMHTCLSSSGGVSLFYEDDDDDIGDSSRLVWAPEYWHAASTSGLSWQPIMRFRLVYLAGTYFNCSGNSCGIVFYPDLESDDPMCDPSGSGCKQIGLDQLSAYLLPIGSVSEDSVPPFPGADSDFHATLFK